MNLKALLEKRDALLATVDASGMTDEIRTDLTTLNADITQARSDEALLVQVRAHQPAGEVRTIESTVTTGDRDVRETEGVVDTRANLTKWIENGNRGSATVAFGTRAASTVTRPAAGDANGSAVRPVYEGIQGDARFVGTLISLLPSRPLTSAEVLWVEMVLKPTAATTLAEGQKYAQADFEFISHSVKPAKVGVFAKASKEVLRDVSEMQGLISTDLEAQVVQEANDQVANGDGTGTNLKGIFHADNVAKYSTYEAEAGESMFESLIKAQAAPVLRMYPVKDVLVNRVELASVQMELLKSFNAIMDPRIPGALTAFGLRLIPADEVAAGHFLGCQIDNPNVWELRPREVLSVETATTNEDDWLRDLVAIKAHQELGLAIKRPQTVVYGTFATA